MRSPSAVILLLAGASAAWAKSSSGDHHWTPEVALRGVDPAKKTLYTAAEASDTFKCLDGSKSILFASVNDDYCDCPDGTDEPGTSACANGVFHCKNERHVGADIPSSRVNDGICDPECCDGSDEYLGIVKCPNTCMEVGAAHRKEVEAQRVLLAESEKIAKGYAEYAAQQSASRGGEIAKLERKLRDLNARVDELKELKKAAEDFAEREKGRGGAADCCPKIETCKALIEQHTEIVDKLDNRLEFLKEAAQQFENFAEESISEDDAAKKAFDLYSEYKALEEPDVEVTDPDAEDSEGDTCCAKLDSCRASLSRKRDEFSRGKERLNQLVAAYAALEAIRPEIGSADSAVKSVNRKYADYLQIFNKEEIAALPNAAEIDDEKSTNQPTEEECKDPLTKITRCLPGKAVESAKSLWSKVVTQVKKVTEGEDNTALAHDAGKAAAKLSKVESEISDVQGQLDEKKKLRDTDFGPAGVWEKIFKDCVSLDTSEYTYEVCLLDRASQKQKNGGHGPSLGSFQKWGRRDGKETAADKYKYMMYDHGERCWNGPERSVQVQVECGRETKLLSVVEMSKCEYDAKMTSPAACELAKKSAHSSSGKENVKDEL
ncbi:glucosidase II beta subunit-like-domain-containing protein [Fimicolochytrium jonesii]|uniref:glucosidase II beta subunit-like-domain-containing protein n=1 Tax=Fimicolochytrium jonesii TaxID=1396493 RepID=UPI0022FF1E06|nr:glucosidase II beta subunit-like-domain-containing protein [Fimicolochytrium jonesii]KAI8818404.1 glucosidase II beta subunit-like-domain-containing protein [Fimicolochytrium jonesii]